MSAGSIRLESTIGPRRDAKITALESNRRRLRTHPGEAPNRRARRAKFDNPARPRRHPGAGLFQLGLSHALVLLLKESSDEADVKILCVFTTLQASRGSLFVG